MGSTPTTRASLLLQLADSRNQQAWIEFANLYEPLVHRLLRKTGLQDADIREITQEVFVAVSLHVRTFEPAHAEGSFRGWLARITRNLLINLLEKQRRKPWMGSGSTDMLKLLQEIPAPTATESVSMVEMELRRRLFHYAADRIRKEFKPATWQAFWLTWVESEEVDQVSQRLGMTAGAIYIARSRVIARLKDEIARMENEEARG